MGLFFRNHTPAIVISQAFRLPTKPECWRLRRAILQFL